MATFLSYTTMSGEQKIINADCIEEVTRTPQGTVLITKTTDFSGETCVGRTIIKNSFEDVEKQLKS